MNTAIKCISIVTSSLLAVILIYTVMYTLIKPPVSTGGFSNVEISVLAAGFMSLNNKADKKIFVYSFIHHMTIHQPHIMCMCSFFDPVRFRLDYIYNNKLNHDLKLSRSDIFTGDSIIKS